MVVHAYDPSNLESWGRKITSLKPASAAKQAPKQFSETLFQNLNKGLGMWLSG